MKNVRVKKLMVTAALLLVTALVMGLCSGAAYKEQSRAGDSGCSGCAIACAACAACTACTCLSCLTGSGATDALSSVLEDATGGYGSDYGSSFGGNTGSGPDTGANVGDSISFS